MKTILMTISLLLGANAAVAQKTVYIVNVCNDVNFYLYGIESRDAGGAEYPWCGGGPSGGVAIIPPAPSPNSSYILTATPASTTKFPFNSPTTSPAISTWGVFTAYQVYSSYPSFSVATAYGNTQVISDVKFELRKVETGTLLLEGHLHPDATNNYHQSFSVGTTVTVDIDVVDINGYTANGETYITIY